MFSLTETPESGSETFEPPTQTRVYNALGEADMSVVRGYALSGTPNSVYHPRGALYRKDIRIDPLGYLLYRVTVPYGLLDRTNPPKGKVTFSFSTTGGTANIKLARAHVASYPDDGPWHAGSINVGSDGEVQGVDIVIPALKLSYTFTHPLGLVNESYAQTLASVTGRVNSAPFRTFAAGELLFIGADGSDGTEADASVTYNFIASSNESSLTLGDIAGIVKEGHHYAWVEFYDDIHDGAPVRKPRRVHIERVYESFNFYSIFGWQ